MPRWNLVYENGGSHRLSAEYLRVFSPSAEVQYRLAPRAGEPPARQKRSTVSGY
ncbi:MAG: gamma-butyrobetaine hydroxylase-like domain-containing protein [Candidatus Azotimanducaceae bacterium WSBS_2022_MAG_OTU7]